MQQKMKNNIDTILPNHKFVGSSLFKLIKLINHSGRNEYTLFTFAWLLIILVIYLSGKNHKSMPSLIKNNRNIIETINIAGFFIIFTACNSYVSVIIPGVQL
jgi:hypothetical protein